MEGETLVLGGLASFIQTVWSLLRTPWRVKLAGKIAKSSIKNNDLAILFHHKNDVF
jgi:hypothetical protein